MAPSSRTQTGREEATESPGDILRRASGVEGSREALQRIANLVPESPAAILGDNLPLQPDEQKELAAPAFTALDAHHVDATILFRDAAKALGVDAATPAERAKLAFAWTMRQVRVREAPEPLLPPAFVLRRGWGTSAERATVFLALLSQLKLNGVLVARTGDKGQPDVWAVGVLVDNALQLFDSRLGLPLPGEKPGTIATLAELRADPATVLGRLKVGEKPAYDVTPEQAKQSELKIACPLSALASRFVSLEKLLPADGPSLAIDLPALQDRLRKVSAGATVTVWGDACRAQRQFLPLPEGGSDAAWRRQREANQTIFPPGGPPRVVQAMIETLGPANELGLQMQLAFRKPFITLTLDAGSPRELVLRGRYEEAASRLVEMRKSLLQQQKRLMAMPDAETHVAGWFSNQVKPAYVDLVRSERGSPADREAATQRLFQAMKHGSGPLGVLTEGAVANSLLPRVDYLLAQAKHEQAERAAHRKTANSADAWRDAAFLWGRYTDEHANQPAAASARRMLARCKCQLGETDAAVALLAEQTEQLPVTEKMARAYLARQVKARGTSD
jgi:hypothetical protein